MYKCQCMNVYKGFWLCLSGLDGKSFMFLLVFSCVRHATMLFALGL
jgi:hypothetical protein